MTKAQYFSPSYPINFKFPHRPFVAPFASKAILFYGPLVGEQSEPVIRASGGTGPGGVQGQSPRAGAGVRWRSPQKFFEKSKQFRPP